MRHLRNAGLAVLVLVSSTSATLAQRSVNTGAGAGAGGFWELGTDFVGFTHTSASGSSTSTVGFGSGRIRAGRFMSDAISIEPLVTFDRSSRSGFTSTYSSAEVGVLVHLQSDRAHQQVYVRPAVVFSQVSSSVGSSGSSRNQTGVGVGVGFKMPSKMSKRFTVRAEAVWMKSLKSGSTPSFNTIGVMGGVSVYTK